MFFNGQSHKVMVFLLKTGDCFISGLNCHEFALFFPRKSGRKKAKRTFLDGEILDFYDSRFAYELSIYTTCSVFPRKMALNDLYRPLPGLFSQTVGHIPAVRGQTLSPMGRETREREGEIYVWWPFSSSF
jgi:hypothetical protein